MGKKDKPGRITYNFVGKKSDFIKEFLKAIPEPFKPTQKTGWIAMGLLLFVIIYGIIQALAPISDISFDVTKGEALEISIQVGYPMVFFGTSENGTKIEVSVLAAIVDSLVYFILGYIIDILINLFIATFPSESRKAKMKRKPKVFKFQKTKGSSVLDARPTAPAQQPQQQPQTQAAQQTQMPKMPQPSNQQSN